MAVHQEAAPVVEAEVLGNGINASEEAMLRETMEEIGVTPLNYEKWGEICFLENYKGKKLM